MHPQALAGYLSGLIKHRLMLSTIREGGEHSFFAPGSDSSQLASNGPS